MDRAYSSVFAGPVHREAESFWPLSVVEHPASRMSPSGIQSDHFQHSRAQLGRELRENKTATFPCVVARVACWDTTQKGRREPLLESARGASGSGEEKSILFSSFVEGGSDECLHQPCRGATTDQISLGGNSGTTRQPPHWRLAWRLAPRVLL